MFGNVTHISYWHTQQNIEIADLKPFLAGENTTALLTLFTTSMCIFDPGA